MPIRTASVAALSALVVSAHGAPMLPGPAFPTFANAKALETACQRQLDAAARRVLTLERHAPDARWLAASDDLGGFIEDAASPIDLLLNLHPDPAMRDAAQVCAQRWQEFGSSLGQNAKLYRAATRVKPLDAIDREALQAAIDGFEDAGVALQAPQRRRAKQISDRIAELGKKFDKNIRDDATKVPLTVDELVGVPEAVWKDKPRDEAGRLLLGLDYPTYLPVLERGESSAAREKMYRAKANQGGDANLKLLAEIAGLRREYAQLFGMTSFADFQLRRRMAGNVANVERFLGEVKGVVTEREVRDLEELRQAKARHLGQAVEATRLDRWDAAFYTERVRRERYSVDEEAFRPYFPPEESLRFVMRVLEKMLGITYTRAPATLWHPDAQAYAVSDTLSGRAIATLYVDMYPRDGKYNHAAVAPLRGSATRVQRAPQAALMANLDRKGLSLDELKTLLHEMGHAVHVDLSATRYASSAGTSVKWDFVEAPSQMLEDWVYDKRVLATFVEVCAACPSVPDALIDRAIAARDYAKGMFVARQHLYASYDMALYAKESQEPMVLWARMEGATPLGYVAGTRFPAGFAHIASGGYAAGYYGYLWSEVIALDLRTAFAADRLDPTVGMRYRQAVLAQGSQKPPRELVRDFLGRETNSKAFFEDLKK